MAKVDPNWTIKRYPKELKNKLDQLMKEVEPARVGLDELDTTIQHAKTPEEFKEISKLAVGYGNYLRKKLGRLSAAVKNTKSSRYLEIKLDCAKNGLDFVSTVASEEASSFAGDLRTCRDVLEAYVISADNLISICRLNLADYKQYGSNTMLEAGL